MADKTVILEYHHPCTETGIVTCLIIIHMLIEVVESNSVKGDSYMTDMKHTLKMKEDVKHADYHF